LAYALLKWQTRCDLKAEKMSSSLVHENVWIERPRYEEAEEKYHESLNKATLTPLANEVAKARQRLNEIRDNFEPTAEMTIAIDTGAIKALEKKMGEFQKVISSINDRLAQLDSRLQSIEDRLNEKPSTGRRLSHSIELPQQDVEKVVEADDDGVDLFASDSEDDEELNKLKEERLAAYNAKKSNKPAVIAKSSVILDVKPWSDETDMKEMEELIRTIEMDGLLWGASKLVPLAYGINKLQINCVIEDDKVSVDELQEKIEANENYVQSVDIAAFNKI
ncbi:hypothetical protein AMK59_6790, partial [Oryctes borbonicus]